MTLSPTKGPIGTVVTLTGSGFTGAQGVTFSGIPVGVLYGVLVGGALSIVNDTTITCIVPQVPQDNKLSIPVVVTLAGGGQVSATFICAEKNIGNNNNGA